MSSPSPSTYRVIGYDLARALAVMGMAVVNYTSMLEITRFTPAWLEPFIDFLYGRAAAVFVMLAGVSVSLMAYRRPDPADLRLFRKCLMKRSLLLLISGMVLWQWWPADILHFYALFIAVGALAVTWHNEHLRRWTVVVLLISLPVCALLTVKYDLNDAFASGDRVFNPTWLVLDYFTSPYYSVFPWLGFFLTGMLLGRREPADASFWRRACLIGMLGCLAVESFSSVASAWALHYGWDIEGLWWGAYLRSEAFPATPLFVISSACSGLALIGFCRMITFNARRTCWGLNTMAACGRLSLTLYIAHIAWGILFRRWFAISGTGIGSQQMLLAAAAFGALSILFALTWFRHFQRGPIETLFHRLTHGRRPSLKRMDPGTGAPAASTP